MNELYGRKTSMKLNSLELIDVAQLRDTNSKFDFNPMVLNESIDKLTNTQKSKNKLGSKLNKPFSKNKINNL